ncbi:hypothetical protein AMS68_004571 [Peltaster fructicola]|uniref:Uncharacterized protein n=1 Tax=Peltaster fructicola TaxID=286661 RepID=A0A6H0XWF0_9PEZI|nr:hypothetical protein AMS68_004571 [Peltaster fructicola]
MPPRKARISVAQPRKNVSSKKSRKRQLDAFAIAGKIAPEKSSIRRHRLGEVESVQPRKRQRQDEDDDDDEEEEEEAESRQEKRRRKQDDDEVEYGSDSEGNEWTIGAVADDDDESLDSDEAFGESDEERFEGFTFRGSSGSKKKPKSKPSSSRTQDMEIDLNEGPEEEFSEDEDDFGDEGVDLATMLDDDGSEASDESEDEEVSDVQQSSEDEEDDSDGEDRHARLQDFVEGLDRNSEGKNPQVAQPETGEALTLDDLLEDADLDSKTLATLKPKKKHAPELVTSALPKRQQDAIDRKLANKKAKEQLDRWRDTVVQNRRAEFLSFPLRNADEGDLPSTDTFTPTQQSQPANELEASIRQIMEESGMLTKSVGSGMVEEGEHGLLKAEELATNKLPVEEVLQRRAELRRTRELMFREEIKAKRIAKIKSKAYRRVHRKERERLADKERMLMDPEGFANGELNEDEQEEADRRRAEARMSAKHKDSKWARSLRATDRAVWDDDARAGVIEQARRQEELRRRIAGRDVDQSDASDDDDDNDYNGDPSTELARIANADNNDALKGLAALKFMQTAEKRRKAQNNAAIAELQRDLDPTAAEDDSGIEDNGLGRAIFGPKPIAAKSANSVVKRPELEEGSGSEDENEEGPSPVVQHSVEVQKPTKHERAGKASGPLATSRSRTVVDEKLSTTRSAWLTAPKEKKTKLDRKLARSNDNEAIINTRIDTADEATTKTTLPVAQDAASEKSIGNTDGWNTVTYKQDADFDANAGDEDAAERPMLSKAERNAAFHARAFAGDDVAVHFSDEKDALAASEDEKETSTHAGMGCLGRSRLDESCSQGCRESSSQSSVQNKGCWCPTARS